MNENRWQPGDPVNWDKPGELWTAGGLHAFVVESKGRQTGVYNLADNPDATVVMPDGTRVPVRAERLAGEDLDRAWERIADEAPEYLAYRSWTKRPIPIIRLQRETR
jgi:hypothetical protein